MNNEIYNTQAQSAVALQKISVTGTKFQEAGGKIEGVGKSLLPVADAITGFGLKAKDSARVADLMTQAANSGTIGVAGFGESYKYVAPLAQPMGLSIEDVTTA